MTLMQMSRTWWLMGMVALIVGGLMLSTGCAGRSLNSKGHARLDRLGENMAPSTDSLLKASEDQMARRSRAPLADGKSVARDGTATRNTDLMETEPISDEESHIADLWSPSSGEAYWEGRQRAELMAAQQGIKDIHFPFDSWQLTPEAKRILAGNAEWLKQHPKARVTIEGHCDERGTRAYNYILGKQRATMTRNYLAALGVSPQQMVIQSYGKDQPLCRQATEECYAENRRAHFLLGFTVAATTNPSEQ